MALILEVTIHLSNEHKKKLDVAARQHSTSVSKIASAILSRPQFKTPELQQFAASVRLDLKVKVALSTTIIDAYQKEASRLNVSVSELYSGVIAATLSDWPETDEHAFLADQSNSRKTESPLETDVLAEADFHMAYGHYDQAADLVRRGIEREPERRVLKLKLLEVLFVWGDREQFMVTARELAASREQGSPEEWQKVAIMGRQIAPDDPLFATDDAQTMGDHSPDHRETSLHDRSGILDIGTPPPHLQLLIEPGSASASELARLFAELSILYRMCGGSGLTFDTFDAREVERVLV